MRSILVGREVKAVVQALFQRASVYKGKEENSF
jgi:hypothetical protein